MATVSSALPVHLCGTFELPLHGFWWNSTVEFKKRSQDTEAETLFL